MSMYARLSTGGRSLTVLPPSSNGRAKRSPLTNWLLTSPGSSYGPGVKGPHRVRLRSVFSNRRPRSRNISS